VTGCVFEGFQGRVLFQSGCNDSVPLEYDLNDSGRKTSQPNTGCNGRIKASPSEGVQHHVSASGSGSAWSSLGENGASSMPVKNPGHWGPACNLGPCKLGKSLGLADRLIENLGSQRTTFPERW
jgi:hypothetical protein